MQPRTEGWSIVVVGHWNSAIFSPGWIAGRLTSSKEVGIEFAVDEPIQPPRFTFDGISLRLAERRLVLAPSTPDDIVLQQMEDVACKVLGELPHTPISAIGINFQFLEPEPVGTIAELFDLKDGGPLSDSGFLLKSTDIKRTVERDDQLLNLTLSFRENSTILIDFNFHREVKGAPAAREALAAGVVKLKALAFGVLSDIYGAPPE
jgi:hypothetical protein